MAMVEDIYDPLDEYVNTFEPRFKQVAKDTFAQLSKEAEVDIDANRQTCKQLYKAQDDLNSVKSKLGWTIFLCVVMWGSVIGGGVAIYNMYDRLEAWGIVLIAIGIAIALLLLFWKVNPLIKRLKSEQNELKEKVTQHKKEAWQQMASLNHLYDWDVLTRMMTQTVPKLEFDAYFTTQRLADLQEVYGWDGSFNKERSVIYSHSGLINGNPFVLCRTRKMEMEQKHTMVIKPYIGQPESVEVMAKCMWCNIQKRLRQALQPLIQVIMRKHDLSMATSLLPI